MSCCPPGRRPPPHFISMQLHRCQPLPRGGSPAFHADALCCDLPAILPFCSLLRISFSSIRCESLEIEGLNLVVLNLVILNLVVLKRATFRFTPEKFQIFTLHLLFLTLLIWLKGPNCESSSAIRQAWFLNPDGIFCSFLLLIDKMLVNQVRTNSSGVKVSNGPSLRTSTLRLY